MVKLCDIAAFVIQIYQLSNAATCHMTVTCNMPARTQRNDQSQAEGELARFSRCEDELLDQRSTISDPKQIARNTEKNEMLAHNICYPKIRWPEGSTNLRNTPE